MSDREPNPTLEVCIFGPGDEEALENGGREVIARNGYEVGSFELEENLIGEGKGITGYLEVDRRIADDLERSKNKHISLSWGDYTVTFDM